MTLYTSNTKLSWHSGFMAYQKQKAIYTHTMKTQKKTLRCRTICLNYVLISTAKIVFHVFSFCDWIAFIIANKFNFSMQTTHYDTWSIVSHLQCSLYGISNYFMFVYGVQSILLNSASLFRIFRTKHSKIENHIQTVVKFQFTSRCYSERQTYGTSILPVLYRHVINTEDEPLQFHEFYEHSASMQKVWANEIFQIFHSLHSPRLPYSPPQWQQQQQLYYIDWWNYSRLTDNVRNLQIRCVRKKYPASFFWKIFYRSCLHARNLYEEFAMQSTKS